MSYSVTANSEEIYLQNVLLKSSGWGYFESQHCSRGLYLSLSFMMMPPLQNNRYCRLLSLVLATKMHLPVTKKGCFQKQLNMLHSAHAYHLHSHSWFQKFLSVFPSYWASIFRTLSCISFPISAAEHNQVRFCFPLPFVCSIFFLFLPFFT